jgi:hypothetical protein
VFVLEFYGGNADWFKLIGDKKLSDLDLSDLNHLWTADNVRAARASNVAWTDAYNYANADYGQWQVSNIAYWTDFYPGMYQKYLINKIITGSGFTLHGNFWNNNTDLAEGYIPFCGRFKRDRDYSNRNAGEWDTPVSVFNSGTNRYDLELTNTVSQTHYNILNDATGIITILDKCSLTFRLKVTVTNSNISSQAFSFGINYTDDSGTVTDLNIVDIFTDPLDNPIPSGATKTFEKTVTIDMNRSEINFYWLMQLNLGTAVSLCEFEILDYVVDESTDEYLYVDETFNYITVASTLPDMQQKDLLVHFFNEFCLMCQTDHQINYINLFGFNDLNNNKPSAIDWSSRVDNTVRSSTKFVFQDYAQLNKFLYRHDPENQYLEEDLEYNSGSISIDNEYLEIEKVVFQSEFASIIRQNNSLPGGARMAFIPKFIDGDEVDCAPYIGALRYEATHLVTMNGYPIEASQPALHGLSFEYLIDTYYPAFVEIMRYAKIVDRLLLLNSVEINQLDFSRPIYLEQESAYFYINLIDRYCINKKRSTQVQLIMLQ